MMAGHAGKECHVLQVVRDGRVVAPGTVCVCVFPVCFLLGRCTHLAQEHARSAWDPEDASGKRIWDIFEPLGLGV